MKNSIIFFGIDSLRSDHLGCYGYNRNTSPHIDKLASEGSLFLNNFLKENDISHYSIMHWQETNDLHLKVPSLSAFLNESIEA